MAHGRTLLDVLEEIALRKPASSLELIAAEPAPGGLTEVLPVVQWIMRIKHDMQEGTPKVVAGAQAKRFVVGRTALGLFQILDLETGRPVYRESRKAPRALQGNRFQGHYSMNRRFADIDDRKSRGHLTMLSWEDVDTLRVRLDNLVNTYKSQQPQMKPFDVTYPERHSKIVGLNYEDTVELRDMAERLTEILLPATN